MGRPRKAFRNSDPPIDPGVAAPRDKSAAILSAALELFAERGFHGTPVPDVAARAGVGTGTVYRYFPSKEALVNALYQHWKGFLLQSILDDFPGDAPPRKQFHAYWSRMVEFAHQHPRVFAFLELHHHAPYLDEQSRRLEEMAILTSREFIARARTKGLFQRLAPQLVMALVHGALVGLVKAEQQDWVDLDAAASDAVEEALWETIRR